MKLDFETQKWLAEPTLLLGFAREIKTALDDFWNGHHIEDFINTFRPVEVCASVAQLRSRIRAWRRQNVTQGDDFVDNSAVACGYVDSVPYGLIGEHSWWGSERPPESDRWFHSMAAQWAWHRSYGMLCFSITQSRVPVATDPADFACELSAHDPLIVYDVLAATHLFARLLERHSYTVCSTQGWSSCLRIFTTHFA